MPSMDAKATREHEELVQLPSDRAERWKSTLMPCPQADHQTFARHALSSSHGDDVHVPVNLGSTIRRVMRRVGGGKMGSKSSRPTDREVVSLTDHLSGSLSPSASDALAAANCCSGEELEDGSDNGAERAEHPQSGKMNYYKLQLEQEVKRLHVRLQEEIDLHHVLANAVEHSDLLTLESADNLPYKAQELVGTIAYLEKTVFDLEKELAELHYKLCYERNERLIVETHVGFSAYLLTESPPTSGCTWEDHISYLRGVKLCECQPSQTIQSVLLSEHGDQQLVPGNGLLEDQKILELPTRDKEDVKRDPVNVPLFEPSDFRMSSVRMIPLDNVNQLSGEMVRCMKNIFLCLSESCKTFPEVLPPENTSSSPRQSDCATCFSASSAMPSSLRSPSTDTNINEDLIDQMKSLDPYGVGRRQNWGDIGSYRLTTEVSRMSIRKDQLDYASEALKRFRFLVEQLTKVNPASLTNDQRLAFWINLYNALIMHAYLAYGFPRNDIKRFALMQKARYVVGSLLISAAEIEFVILKMKDPAHRPQLALMLDLHRFKITEEHEKYSVHNHEPLALFGLSCGTFSSPAVRIFSAENIQKELQNSMRDYIRASVGLCDRGKLLVPKLLQSHAKETVEDSLLVDWICRQLTPDQVAVVRDSTLQGRRKQQRLLGISGFITIPYDLRFRYLFFPDK